MELIDWAGLARNALWIVGLSVVLAACSSASWTASQRRVRLRRIVSEPPFQAAVAGGMLFAAAALGWGATRVWERAVWLVLAAAFAWQFFEAARALRAGGDHPGGR